MKRKPTPEPKFVTNRPYKMDRAMQQAAERARAVQPAMINMVSKVKEGRQ